MINTEIITESFLAYWITLVFCYCIMLVGKTLAYLNSCGIMRKY